jgi:RNA polymerase sigma-70 factor (ECF subfamily)
VNSAEADSNPEQLMRMAQRGDSKALGDLLELYREYLRLLAQLQINRRLRQKFDASDVVQDVFLQVQRHIPEFRGATEGEFLAWLRKILASCVLKAVRHCSGTRQRQLACLR